MLQRRQAQEDGVLVRFWSLDHHRAEEILWPTSSWAKLVYAVEGMLQVKTASESHLLPTNRAMLILPNEPHPARTTGKARVRTLYFSPQVDVGWQQRVLEVRPLFRELISEACSIGPLNVDNDLHVAMTSLLVAEAKSALSVPTSIPMPRSAWLHEWASKFLDDPTQTTEISYSRRTHERKMLEETGLTLGHWCQQARALVGLRMLSGGASVLEAASEAGFETTSGFIQLFKKQFGVTPGKMFRS